MIDRKYLLSRLFECESCGLYFRHPLENVTSNRNFYQSQYQQADGITTFLPEEGKDLEKVKADIINNPENPKNAQRIRRIFEALFPNQQNISVVDYGASWGYITWQLKSYGLKVQSYEISRPRAAYGNAYLGLDIQMEENVLHGGNHIFFSSHVIEHVPVVSKMLEMADKLVYTDGFIVTLCPNGSPEYRKKDPSGFHLAWGQVHPNYLNANFFQKYYSGRPLFIATTPFDMKALQGWNQKSHFIGELSGSELLVIARPHHNSL